VGTHSSDHQEVFIQWKYPYTYIPPFNLFSDILAGTFGELQKFKNRQRSFYSSSEFVGGLDGSSAGMKREERWFCFRCSLFVVRCSLFVVRCLFFGFLLLITPSPIFLGPNGTIPKWHMHHLNGGSFENLDWNIASYSDTINAPYRVPRSLIEVLGWQGLSMHVHGCELSGT
jgi:hypothetical protein